MSYRTISDKLKGKRILPGAGKGQCGVTVTKTKSKWDKVRHVMKDYLVTEPCGKATVIREYKGSLEVGTCKEGHMELMEAGVMIEQVGE